MPLQRSTIVICALGCCLVRPAQAQDRCQFADPLGEAATLVSQRDTSTLLDTALVREVDTELRTIREHYPQLRTIRGWDDGATVFIFSPYMLKGDDSLRFADAVRDAIARGDTVGGCLALRTTGVARVDSVVARLGAVSMSAISFTGDIASALRTSRLLPSVVVTFRRPVRGRTVRRNFAAVGLMDDPWLSITCWCEPEQSVTWTRTPSYDEFLFHWRSHSGSEQRDTVVRADRRGQVRLISTRETRV
jgi:hypothetical protein